MSSFAVGAWKPTIARDFELRAYNSIDIYYIIACVIFFTVTTDDTQASIPIQNTILINRKHSQVITITVSTGIVVDLIIVARYMDLQAVSFASISSHLRILIINRLH
jgi:hypothetical protein